jgi:hypothetical protein
METAGYARQRFEITDQVDMGFLPADYRCVTMI